MREMAYKMVFKSDVLRLSKCCQNDIDENHNSRNITYLCILRDVIMLERTCDARRNAKLSRWSVTMMPFCSQGRGELGVQAPAL